MYYDTIPEKTDLFFSNNRADFIWVDSNVQFNVSKKLEKTFEFRFCCIPYNNFIEVLIVTYNGLDELNL